MENLSRKAISALLEPELVPPVVTIYAPMHKAATPPHMNEDQIRLKNLMHTAIEALKSRPDGENLAKVLQRQLEELQESKTFWEQQTESLLICASGDTMRLFRLPIDSEEYVVVGDHPQLAPILGLVAEAVEFYVLVLAQHEPALLRGDMYGLHQADIALPVSLEIGLNLDETNQKSEQGRSAEGANAGGGTFNGRGGARDPAPADQARFFRMVDKIICQKVDRTLPLVLAGVESETAEFKELSKYPKILRTTVAGSFGGGRPDELFAPAFAAVQAEIIQANQQAAVQEYEHIRGANPERVASKPAAIIGAAEQGRVDKLLIGMSRYTTDTVRDTNQPSARLTFPETAELINDAALMAWRQGGVIINLDQDHMPEQSVTMVARLRF